MDDREYEEYSNEERFTEKIKNTTDIIEDMKIRFAIWYENRISQCLGDNVKPIPNIVQFEVYEGDKIIIASDGAYKMLSDQDKANLIKRSKNATEATLALVRASREAKGRDDNLDDASVVVMEVGKK